MNKSDIKTWSNAKNEGRLFNCTLMDESGTIRMTAFTEQVDTFYELLQEGHVYYISNCMAKMARKQFNSSGHEYELTMRRDTEVTETDEDIAMADVKFEFVPLSDIAERVEVNAMVDVLAVVKEVGPLTEFTSKAGKEMIKKEISLVDASNAWLRCTLWGSKAKAFDYPEGTVLACKSVKVGDFQGKNLSIGASSTVDANPDIDEAHALKGWYDAQGRRGIDTFQAAPSTFTGGRGEDKRLNLQEIEIQEIGRDKTDFFSTKATVTFIKLSGNFCYNSCSNGTCKKKVETIDDDLFKCHNCNTTQDKPNFRYVEPVFPILLLVA